MSAGYVWALWVFSVLVSFFAIELPGVAWERTHGSGRTLSAQLRLWFAFSNKPKGYRLRRMAWLVIAASGPVLLTAHLLSWF